MADLFVQFLKDVGSWPEGKIVAIPDGVAKAYIGAGQAVESNAIEHLKASMESRNKEFEATVLAVVERGSKPRPSEGPPNGGGRVDFGKVGTQVPAEERDERRSLTEAMHCIFVTNCSGADHAYVQYCKNRLRGYSDEFNEYNFNPATGKLETVQTRMLSDGGLETITRTGTDSISGGPTYGFTVKPEYLPNLFRVARESEVFASDTRNIPVTQGNEAIWPALDQFKAPTVLQGIPQAAVFGGIQLAYAGEVTQRPSSDAATYENRHKIVDLTGSTSFSRDYIVDNYIAMDTEVTRLFGEAIGWIEDYVFIHGDGLGKPQGYFNATATITSGPNSGARYNANEISVDDLTYMLAHIATMCWPSMRWLANVTTLPQIYALQNHAGAYVFQPNALIDQEMILSIMKGSTVDESTLVSRPMGILLGKPIYFTEKVPVLGATGDISAVCPRQYGNAKRAGLEVGVSEHYAFLTDLIWYRFKYRHYGRSLWRAPYTQADNPASPASGTQVSPFFCLHS